MLLASSGLMGSQIRGSLLTSLYLLAFALTTGLLMSLVPLLLGLSALASSANLLRFLEPCIGRCVLEKWAILEFLWTSVA